jgi:hypothetical protein
MHVAFCCHCCACQNIVLVLLHQHVEEEMWLVFSAWMFVTFHMSPNLSMLLICAWTLQQHFTKKKIIYVFFAQFSTRSTCWRNVCCISCLTKVICACLFVHDYLFQQHHLKSFVFWFVCIASLYYINVLPKKQCNWLFWLLMMVDWTLVATKTHMHWWWWASDENILIEPIFQHF